MIREQIRKAVLEVFQMHHGQIPSPDDAADEVYDQISLNWAVYLTQVTTRCSIACHGGLSTKSGRI